VELKYPCGGCNKPFSNKNKLKIHQHVHTGEHPYCCDGCNKTFSKTYILKVHKHVHTGERPYCCHVNETFTSSKLPYFPAHKTHCDLFLGNFRKKIYDDRILILVIYWKKTELLHTKISNRNIIYSS
jgi:hypothetical protein